MTDKELIVCPKCGGTGLVGVSVKYTCAICDGKGKIYAEPKETVEIVAVVDKDPVVNETIVEVDAPPEAILPPEDEARRIEIKTRGRPRKAQAQL